MINNSQTQRLIYHLIKNKNVSVFVACDSQPDHIYCLSINLWPTPFQLRVYFKQIQTLDLNLCIHTGHKAQGSIVSVSINTFFFMLI